jgi:hypothetical protein
MLHMIFRQDVVETPAALIEPTTTRTVPVGICTVPVPVPARDANQHRHFSKKKTANSSPKCSHMA